MSSVIAVSAVVFVVMSLAVLAMAVGVMFTGREIQGSCGGLNTVDGADCACKGSCDAEQSTSGAKG